jgi:hypothetical protein
VLRKFLGTQADGRPWFEDDYFDLILWTDASNDIQSFQLCYGKPDAERALTWDRARGYGHFKIERGETDGYRKSPRTLWPTPGYPHATVVSEFQDRSSDLPSNVRGFVLAALWAAPASP